jgi:hypothetical protein
MSTPNKSTTMNEFATGSTAEIITALRADADRFEASGKVLGFIDDMDARRNGERVAYLRSVAATVERLQNLANAVKVAEFSGISCQDVNGKNWFDERRALTGRR